jgi:dihydrofolate reductase
VAKIVADISMSLDGFVTGPNPDLAHGLGRGGEPLHTWAFATGSEVDAEVLRQSTEETGAVVMGRRLFDIIDGPHGWDDDVGYGARHAAQPPVFVVTHTAPTTTRLGPRFTFVTEGIEPAIEAARQAAEDKNAVVMGGADVVRQAVRLGLAEELRLHLAPVLLGSGTALFEGGDPRPLVQTSVRVSPNATHLTYALGGT